MVMYTKSFETYFFAPKIAPWAYLVPLNIILKKLKFII